MKGRFFSFEIMLETVKEFKYLMVVHAALLAVFSTLPGIFLGEKYIATYFMSLSTPLTFIAAVLFPTVTALGVFSYLFKQNASEFYNSMPYTRRAMYLSKYAAGLIICLLPLLFIFAINSFFYVVYDFGGVQTHGGFILNAKSELPYGLMLSGLGKTALSYAAVLSLGAFAAAVSGSLPAALGMMGALTIGKTLALSSLTLSFNMWFENIAISEWWNVGFPPTKFFLVSNLLALSGAGADAYETGEYIYAFLYAAVFFAAGLAFYRARKAERRGFYAFGWINVCFKYVVSMIFSLTVGFLFALASKNRAVIDYIGYALTLFIAFYAIEAAQSGGFRGIFKNIRSFAVFAVIWLVMLAIPLNFPVEDFILRMPVRGEVSFDYGFVNGMKFNSKEIKDFLNSAPPMTQGEISQETMREETENPRDDADYALFIDDSPSETHCDFYETIFKAPDFTITAKKMRKRGEDELIERIESSGEYKRNLLKLLSNKESLSYIWVNIYESGGLDITDDEFVKILYEDVATHTYDECKKGGIFGEAQTDEGNGIIYIYNCYEDSVNYINERTGGNAQ